jgi:ribosome maturation factor RimP
LYLCEKVGFRPLFFIVSPVFGPERGAFCLTVDEIIRTAWAVFDPELTEQGYELVEVEYGRQEGVLILRVYVDKTPGGITLDDCTAVSQLLSPVLDTRDFIGGEYMLEVSSPGFDRPIRKPEHFVRFAGEPVKVVTNALVGGRSRFSGVLKGFDDGLVLLEVDGEPVSIHIENLKKARLNR